MKPRTVYLHNPQQAAVTLHGLADELKPWLLAGHRYVLSVRPETRTLAQNARFHAICGDLQRSRLPWAGQARQLQEWKVLTVSGHGIATGQGVEIVRGFEDEPVNLYESTSRMTVGRKSSLIDYATAFCAANRVPLSDPQTLAYEKETP